MRAQGMHKHGKGVGQGDGGDKSVKWTASQRGVQK